MMSKRIIAQTEPLITEDFNRAESYILKDVQRTAFKQEINNLQDATKLPPYFPIRDFSLLVFLFCFVLF